MKGVMGCISVGEIVLSGRCEGCCVSVPCGCALVAASVHVVDINAARCWE